MFHILLNETDPLPGPGRRDQDLIAVSGHLSSQRLLEGYQIGLFPWNNSDEEPVKWWSPKLRAVFLPDSFHESRSMRRFLRSSPYRATFDQAFLTVVEGCANRNETWITPRMISCYKDLHAQGFAHSVEVWSHGILAGGVFGISIGRIFIAESMYSKMKNASKFALKTLLDRLREWQFLLLDAQIPNPHLTSLGSVNIEREEYLATLKLDQELVCSVKGKWNGENPSLPWRRRSVDKN